VILSPEAQRAQLQAIVGLCDGGSLTVREGAKVLATFQLPTPAFSERGDGMFVCRPAPEEAAAGGRAETYQLLQADGTLVGSGLVGGELTITPPELREGTRVVADALVLAPERIT
jgi:hypothetical protein